MKLNFGGILASFAPVLGNLQDAGFGTEEFDYDDAIGLANQVAPGGTASALIQDDPGEYMDSILGRFGNRIASNNQSQISNSGNPNGFDIEELNELDLPRRVKRKIRRRLRKGRKIQKRFVDDVRKAQEAALPGQADSTVEQINTDFSEFSDILSNLGSLFGFQKGGQIGSPDLSLMKKGASAIKNAFTSDVDGYYRQKAEKLLQANSDLNFVKRIKNPDMSINNKDGSVSTHLMRAEVDEKGVWHVFPEIVEKDGKLTKLSPDEAFSHAKKTGQSITTNDKGLALWLAADNYKNVKFADGGIINDALAAALGYSDGSPYRDAPAINIPGNTVDMSRTSMPVIAMPDAGNPRLLLPSSGLHTFDGASHIMEIPAIDPREEVETMATPTKGTYSGEAGDPYEYKYEEGSWYARKKGAGNWTKASGGAAEAIQDYYDTGRLVVSDNAEDQPQEAEDVTTPTQAEAPVSQPEVEAPVAPTVEAPQAAASEATTEPPAFSPTDFGIVPRPETIDSSPSGPFSASQQNPFLSEPPSARIPEDQEKYAQEPSGVVADSLSRAITKEEAAGYDTLYNYANEKNTPYKDVDVTQMTIDQVLDFQKEFLAYNRETHGKDTSAVGKYQFVGRTLRDLKDELGLSGDEQFTPELQDKLAKHLFDRRMRWSRSPTALRKMGLGHLKPGSQEAKREVLKKEWEGFQNLSDEELDKIIEDQTALSESLSDIPIMRKGGKVSSKIRKLRKEGKPQSQAVAIALNMRRRGKLQAGGEPAEAGNMVVNPDPDPDMGIPVQTELGEVFVTPELDIIDARARSKHSEMDSDLITDVLKPSYYVFSDDDSIALTRDKAKKISFGYGSYVYEENNPEYDLPDEITLEKLFKKGEDKLTFASLAKRVRAMYPVSEEDDMFSRRSSFANKESREGLIQALVYLNEEAKGTTPQEMQSGGFPYPTNFQNPFINSMANVLATDPYFDLGNENPNNRHATSPLIVTRTDDDGLKFQWGALIGQGIGILAGIGSGIAGIVQSNKDRKRANRQARQNAERLRQSADQQLGFNTLGSALALAGVSALNTEEEAPQLDTSYIRSMSRRLPASALNNLGLRMGALDRGMEQAIFRNSGDTSRAINSASILGTNRARSLADASLQMQLQNQRMRDNILGQLDQRQREQAMLDAQVAARNMERSNNKIQRATGIGVNAISNVAQNRANLDNALAYNEAQRYAAVQAARQNKTSSIQNMLGSIAGGAGGIGSSIQGILGGGNSTPTTTTGSQYQLSPALQGYLTPGFNNQSFVPSFMKQTYSFDLPYTG